MMGMMSDTTMECERKFGKKKKVCKVCKIEIDIDIAFSRVFQICSWIELNVK